MSDMFGGGRSDTFKRPTDPIPASLMLTHRGAAHNFQPSPPISSSSPFAVRDTAARLKSVRAKPYARGGSACCRGGVTQRSQMTLSQPPDQLYDRMPAYLTSFSSGSLLPCHNKDDIAHAAMTISSSDLRFDDDCSEEDNDLSLSPCSFSSNSSPCSFGSLRPASSLSRLEEIKLSESAEANERRIVFLGRLPRDWSDPAEEIEAILRDNDLGPAQKVVVKKRDSALLLDSYAFIYFHDTQSAHRVLGFLQKHRRYRHFNVSFGGRDTFLNGQEYADLDSLPGAVSSVCPTLNPDKVAASLSNGRGLLASLSSSCDFSDLLREHKRWQQHKRQE